MYWLLLILSLFIGVFSTKVNVLTEEDIRKILVKTPYMVIFTHNSMCDDCHRQMAIFKNTVENMEFSSNPYFYTADCSITSRICRRFRVRQQPTVLIINRERTAVRYNGDFDSVHFRLFLHRNLSLNNTKLSSVQLRIIFLVVILVALVILFLKSVRSNYPETHVANSEEHAPLVEHPVTKSESQI